MKPVTLNRLTIGSELPRICVPIVVRTKAELKSMLQGRTLLATLDEFAIDS